MPEQWAKKWGRSCAPFSGRGGGSPYSSPPVKGHSPPIFGPCSLWPNGWMDEDTEVDVTSAQATLLDGNPAPSAKGGTGHSSPAPFLALLLWPRSPRSATDELLYLKLLLIMYKWSACDIYQRMRMWANHRYYTK